MASFMDSLEAAPPDPLLGLMLAAREDQRPDKVDLGVGIYKNDAGATPVLASVKEAERRLIETEGSKAYEGPQGNAAYGQLIGEMIVGELTDRHAMFATPGGCGALFIGFQLAKMMSPGARMFLSDPSWPNHNGVAAALDIPTVSFPYRATTDGSPDFGAMVGGLDGAKAGDILLLQGYCHNPTGTDLSPAQWEELSRIILEKGLIPFIDVAYQGFAVGLEEDILPIRKFLAAVPEAILSYSCSKNFGLYRERTGALLIQAPSAGALDSARSRTAAAVRASYSMPPSHGPAIVATILADDGLRSQWTEELGEMRQRLGDLRRGFASELVRATNNGGLEVIERQNGMFSILPLTADRAVDLRKEQGIYLPGSGRINVAGLPSDRLPEIAQKIAPYLNQAG
ncbi:aspartate/tyrosine/aromatic aminotransferase [Parvularcula sp. ZS-1/3]|uniref:Aspartate/tyrosine/aromatic aminotransferase n=1 Tax=Parvularcula mediterranea TaxID=2732508 RepID=A0A7Y3RIN9_9PROT|nr:amino acid aminotransferase [Parvularcula mediterranea]NNU14716.1 aspartate/tyrosine/aromatic aminotransferase [Parvularcula mediterranea]